MGLSPVNGLFSNSNFAHAFFGLLSCIPGPVGSLASLADAIVYALVDKDYGMATLCAMDAISFGLSKAATSLMRAKKLTNTAQALMTTSRMLSTASSFGMCAQATMATGFTMYNKYCIQGQKADGDTKWEILSIGISTLGCVISGRGLSKSTKQMAELLETDGFLDALKLERGQYGCAMKSAVKGGNYCFVAGTLIHTEDGTEAIENIRTGDYVLAYNEETGETGYKKVVNLFRNTTEELAHVKVAGTEEIICTPGHKFYVEGKWISAGEMKQGDVLTLADGTTTEVLSVTIEKLETPVTIYNFEVEDWHTYYVADSGVLVHNMCVLGKGVNTTVVGSGKTGKSGRTSRKSINLPSAKKVKIDMEEVISGHTLSGKRAQQSLIKDLFPDRMDAKDIEKEIREAYGNAKPVGSPQFDGVDTRIKLQGNGRNGVVEMWYNKSSKTIETAYPIDGKKVKID